MSTTVMGFCWPLQLPPTQKAVLMALADAANDDGVCWIAVKSRREDKLDLMVKTCLSERAVQAAIKALVDCEWLERNEKPGLGCWYIVTPPGFLAGRPPAWLLAPSKKTPAPSAGVQEERAQTPAPQARTPATGAGKPSSTVKSSEAKASSSRAKTKSKKVEKMHLVPEDWEPKDAHRDKVAAFGWPDGMFEDQLERFREWEFREGKVDFDRAFHRWLRTENDRLKGRTDDHRSNRFGARPGPGGGPTPRGERIDAMREGAMGALDRFQREGR